MDAAVQHHMSGSRRSPGSCAACTRPAAAPPWHTWCGRSPSSACGAVPRALHRRDGTGVRSFAPIVPSHIVDSLNVVLVIVSRLEATKDFTCTCMYNQFQRSHEQSKCSILHWHKHWRAVRFQSAACHGCHAPYPMKLMLSSP